MAKKWKQYQEDSAIFFRSIGLDAKTDITVKGVRTTHDIDVLVKSHHAGFDITWIVECKHWKTRVSKLHVLALREIVSDLGADRGILLSEKGFQRGAIEAANLTNVQITSIAKLRLSSRDSIHSMRLHELFDRIEQCKERYWDIPKHERIKHGLRPDVMELGYSGNQVIDLCSELFFRSFRNRFPIESDTLKPFFYKKLPKQFKSANHVLEFTKPLIVELEAKLDLYKSTMEASLPK